ENTVGESFKKAYEGSALDLWFQRILRRGTVSGSLPDAIRQYVDNFRPQRLSEMLSEMLTDRGHLAGFPVDDVRATKETITVQLGAGSANVVRLGEMRLGSLLDRVPVRR